MASGKIYKLKHGYQVVVSTGKLLPDGRYERIRKMAGKRKSDADALLADLLSRYSRSDSRDNDYPLDLLLGDWADHLRATRKADTAEGYLLAARRMLAALDRCHTVADVTPGVCESAVRGMVDAGTAPRTANTSLLKLRSMIRWGVSRGIVATCPADGAVGVPPVPKKVRRALGADEVSSLLGSASDLMRPIWRFFLSTGVRRGELVSLRWDDIQGNTVRIQPHPDGWTPKTAAGIRTIPLTDAVQDDLARLPRLGEWVFCTPQGRQRKNNLLRSLRATMRRLVDDPERIDLHSLRYTFATHLIAGGVDPKTVQRLMGHETLDMTLRIYAQYCPQRVSDSVGVLPY